MSELQCASPLAPRFLDQPIPRQAPCAIKRAPTIVTASVPRQGRQQWRGSLGGASWCWRWKRRSWRRRANGRVAHIERHGRDAQCHIVVVLFDWRAFDQCALVCHDEDERASTERQRQQQAREREEGSERGRQRAKRRQRKKESAGECNLELTMRPPLLYLSFCSFPSVSASLLSRVVVLLAAALFSLRHGFAKTPRSPWKEAV